MGETSRLAGAAVDSDPDVQHVADVAEHAVEVGVGHLEGEVADEEGLGGGVLGLVGGGLAAARVGHVVHDDAAAFEDGHVLGLDGLLGDVDGLELDVSEPGTHG